MSTEVKERFGLSRFRNKNIRSPTPPPATTTPPATGMELVKRKEDEAYDAPLPRTPIEVFDSGPVLVANSLNRDSAAYELPGEGKILRTTEEGSRVWKHKTRRTYHEDVKKEKQSSEPLKNNSSAALSSPSVPRRSKKTHLGDTHYFGRTDDDKFVSTIVSQDHYSKKAPSASTSLHRRTPSPSPARMSRSYDRSYHSSDRKTNPSPLTSTSISNKYTVRMEDKSIQCNLKKSKSFKKNFEIAQDFKVIKSTRDGSVSAFSDVSVLEDPGKKEEKVLYTTVETVTPTETVYTREMHELKKEKDYSYGRSPSRVRDRKIEVTRTPPRPSSSGYSPTPSRTRVVTKSYGLNAGLEGAPDVTPRQSPLLRSTPRPVSNSWYYDQPGPLDIGSSARLESPSRSRNLAHETIEETISISNSSGDEVVDSHKDAHTRVVKAALQQQEKELQDINANYLTQPTVIRRDHYDIDSRLARPTGGDFTLERKSREIDPYTGLDAQLARSTSHLNSVTGGPPGMWSRTTPDNDYRRNLAKNQDINLNTIGVKPADHDHFCSATIARSNRRTTPIIDSNSVQSYTLDRKHLNERRKKAMSSFGGVSHDPLGGTNSPLYRKAPSLPENQKYMSDPSVPLSPGMRRYNSTRDVSLSDYRRGGLAAAFRERQERASSLNRSIEREFHGSDYALASRYDPKSRASSRYESEPEVHYVPVKQDTTSYLGRSQSILAPKRNEKYTPTKSRERMSPGVHWATMNKEYSLNPEGRDMQSPPTSSPEGKPSKISKKDLKRSQSIPKDTKFPWLQRLKLRVKAREP